MKRFLCSVVVCFFTMGVLVAEAAETNSTIDTSDDTPVLERNTNDSNEQTETTIDSNKLSFSRETMVFVPILLNIIPGFGLGSSIQGDSKGKKIGKLLSTIVTVTVATPLLVILGGIIIDGLFGWAYIPRTGTSILAQAPNILKICFIAGGIMEVGNIAWGIARPIYFRNQNTKRNSATAETAKETLAVVPVITNNSIGATVIVRL